MIFPLTKKKNSILRSRKETANEIVTSSFKKVGKAKNMKIHGTKVKMQNYNFSYSVKKKVEKVQNVLVELVHYKDGSKSFRMKNKGFDRLALVGILGVAQNSIYKEILTENDIENKWSYSHPHGSKLTIQPRTGEISYKKK
jgi:hypothetical protein